MACVQPARKKLPACDNPLDRDHKLTKMSNISPIASQLLKRVRKVLPKLVIDKNTMLCYCCRLDLQHRVEAGKYLSSAVLMLFIKLEKFKRNELISSRK